MNVAFFHRKRHAFHFSIEKIFDEVRKHLPAELDAHVLTCPYESQGFLPRLKNALWAARNKAAVNHITGDVHYLTAFLPPSKTVLTIHDCGFMNHPSRLARAVLWLFWLKLPVKQAKFVTTISESTKRDVIHYTKCDPSKVRVIPDCTDPLYQASAKPFNSQKPSILIVGTKPNKNVPRVIEALKGIACSLQIVGQPKPELQAQLEASGVEHHWHSRLSDSELYKLYQQSDILLFASTLEGFGMPILEAQSVGRVVVTSNISSMPEIAGKGAYLVDPFDTASIREGIGRVIADEPLREELIRLGFENIGRFHPQQVAQMYHALYQEVVATPEA